jgi:hypothetical protein
MAWWQIEGSIPSHVNTCSSSCWYRNVIFVFFTFLRIFRCPTCPHTEQVDRLRLRGELGESSLPRVKCVVLAFAF